MSYMIAIPDDVFVKLTERAQARGEPVERIVADALARELGMPESPDVASGRLDWESASAEEIIADLQASRVERERPVEL